MPHGNFCAKHGYHIERDCPECVAKADACIDCEGAGKYPSGADCVSYGATGLVLAGDGERRSTAH